MRTVGAIWMWLLLLAVCVQGQDDGCGCGCGCGDDEDDGDVEITIDGGVDESGDLGIRADPFEERLEQPNEENKPPPIQVGQWEPPALDKAASAEHRRLLALRSASPDDAGIRYRLAEFYFAHKWFKQCEAEYRACAQRDPESIRPWEGLLRLYATESTDPAGEEFVGLGGIRIRRQGTEPARDWLTDSERRERILRAHREIIRRRPDDIARRRTFLEVLKKDRLFDELVEQCRAILERMPGAAGARYELAEALIKKYVAARRKKWSRTEDGDPDGPPPAGPWDRTRDEAIALLEENLRRAPNHARSSLRLVRLLAERSGRKATGRIGPLEQRGAFDLAIKRELADVPYRKDTWRMLRDLIGPRVANRLWDEAFVPEWYHDQRRNAWRNDGRIYYRRWVVVYFPHAQTLDRLPVIRRLGRRADREAAGILASFLWHTEDWRAEGREQTGERDALRKIEEEATTAIAGLGNVAFPLAERFLKLADTPARRRRAIGILARLKDKRAARPLVDALPFDNAKDFSLGVPAALERLGDPVAIDALVEAVFDVRRPLPRRIECAEALAAFRDPRCVEALGRLRNEKGFAAVAGYGMYRLAGDEDALDAVGKGLLLPATAADALRYLAKCEGAKARALLLAALRDAPVELRPRILRELRERAWEHVRADVVDIFLELAESPAAGSFVLGELGRIGGEKVATKLLELAGKAKSFEDWSPLARALALTGDPRAVRYFNKMRILERDSRRRKLAVRYHELAARRAKRE